MSEDESGARKLLFSGKRRHTLFTRTRLKAKGLDNKLRERYEGRDISKTSLWCRLVSPDVNNLAEFDYMGRDLTRQVKEYILAPFRNAYRIRVPQAKIKHITGMPGCGKTVSVTAAVGQLHVESQKEAAVEKGVQASEKAMQLDQVAGTGQLPTLALDVKFQEGSKLDLKGKQVAELKNYGGKWDRFLLMSGHIFGENPNETFYTSLITAFINDEDALAMLEHLDYDNRNELSSFLQERKEELYVIVDDGNAMDDYPNARSLLTALAAANDHAHVTVCWSIRSKLRQQLLKVKKSEYLLITDGFSDEELQAFLTHNGKTLQNLRTYKTGKVPRLVDDCLNDRKSFHLDVKWHEKVLRGFIYSATRVHYKDLLDAVSGGKIDKLSSALDSRCYFQGTGGKAQCLTQYLHSRANSWMAEVVTARSEQEALEQLEPALKSIRLESNKALIGWSAETAVILTLRLLGIHLTLGDSELNIKPGSVSVVKKMTKSTVRGVGSVLYLPAAFNHAGLDAYYENDECLVVFQITISATPERTHISTSRVAEAIFEGDNRIKVLVWVTYQHVTKVVRPSADRPYYELFLTFRDLHDALRVIDEKLKEIRGRQANCCSVCKLHPDVEVECSRCGWWFHKSCYSCSDREDWLCPDCVVIFQQDVETEEDDGGSDEDYEDEAAAGDED